jgi:hypothetical protein
MGLDMYLETEIYISGWKDNSDEEKSKYKAIFDQVGLKGPICVDSPSLTVAIIVAYWRKANAIHKWFVDNVQDGKDDCQTSYAPKEKLEELLSICKKVQKSFKLVPARVHNGTRLTNKEGRMITERIMEDGYAIEDPSVAMELLPVQNGFFFGKTIYDQYYASYIEDTIKQLEKVLDYIHKDKFSTINYRSSW